MKSKSYLTMFFLSILLAAIAAFGVVQVYIQNNRIWMIIVTPWVIMLMIYAHKIQSIKKRINDIETNFKEKFGYNIDDRDPFDN